MSSARGQFAFIRNGLEVQGSVLLGEVGLSVAGRKQCDFSPLFVDRKIARRLKNQFLNRLEPNLVVDPLLDLDGIWGDFDLGRDLGRFFAAAARSTCYENGVWQQAAKVELGRSIGVRRGRCFFGR